jgi:hypothetical protein
MNALGSDSNSVSQTTHDADATLRLIAGLPTPGGLEKRVIAGLRSAPRSGRIISWPRLLNPTENWLRSAAAAAIVFVVIGGGWGVYSHVKTTNATAAPPTTGAGGAFSNAGARVIPHTLTSPVVVQPPPAQSRVDDSAKNVGTKVAPGTHRVTKPAANNKLSVQPYVPPAK